jgi:hypothetical protein
MNQSQPGCSTARRNLSVLELFGFKCASELVLCCTTSKETARQAILSGNQQKLGNGMRKGRIVAKVHGDHVKISFLTPRSRSWYGPIYEATLQELMNGKIRLYGKFRLTVFETLNCLLLQFGLSLWLVEGLVVGGYRGFGIGFGAALGLSLSGIIGIMFLPRLSWISRKWKIEALKEHLLGLGFEIR